jgi:hypothetical protein
MQSFVIGGHTKEIIESVVTSGLPPEEVVKQLDSYGIEWYVTEEGDLMLRYWQVGAEDFVPTEHVARIREGRTAPQEATSLEWVSRNLADLRARFAGQWIGIANGEVVASAASLPELLARLRAGGVEKPLITEIPAGPIVWHTAYAG